MRSTPMMRSLSIPNQASDSADDATSRVSVASIRHGENSSSEASVAAATRASVVETLRSCVAVISVSFVWSKFLSFVSGRKHDDFSAGLVFLHQPVGLCDLIEVEDLSNMHAQPSDFHLLDELL